MNKVVLVVTTFCLVSSLASSQQALNASTAVVLDNENCRKINDYLTELQNNRNFSGGLLIIKDGKKILSKGYGWANKEKKIPFTSSTLASMGSITKAFTAAAIMKLSEQGKLSTDDRLKKFSQISRRISMFQNNTKQTIYFSCRFSYRPACICAGRILDRRYYPS